MLPAGRSARSGSPRRAPSWSAGSRGEEVRSTRGRWSDGSWTRDAPPRSGVGRRRCPTLGGDRSCHPGPATRAVTLAGALARSGSADRRPTTVDGAGGCAPRRRARAARRSGPAAAQRCGAPAPARRACGPDRLPTGDWLAPLLPLRRSQRRGGRAEGHGAPAHGSRAAPRVVGGLRAPALPARPRRGARTGRGGHPHLLRARGDPPRAGRPLRGDRWLRRVHAVRRGRRPGVAPRGRGAPGALRAAIGRAPRRARHPGGLAPPAGRARLPLELEARTGVAGGRRPERGHVPGVPATLLLPC